MIRSEEGTFKSSDGAALYWRSWVPSEFTARVVVVHGLGEHCSRYHGLAERLAGRGLAVFTYDHRGHGRSGGQRGHIRRFDVFAGDLATAFRLARTMWPGDQPTGWVAHSMGALIALRYLTQEPTLLPDCAILSAPWLKTKTPVAPALKRLAKVLDRIWPNAPFSNAQAHPNRLTRDPEVAEAWFADPLIHSKVTPRLFCEAERAQTAVLKHGGPLPVPAFFLIPTDDEVVDAELAEQYARSLGGDTRVLLLSGLRHEPFNEVEREDVYATAGEWLEQRLIG